MRYIAFVGLLLGMVFNTRAQYCTTATSTTAITPTSTAQTTATYGAGTAPVFTFTGTAGCTYTFTTCGLSSVDTYLRIYNSSVTLVQGWDDQCGLQTNAVWTCPTTAAYSIQLSQYVCGPLLGSASMSYSVSCPTPPCSNPVVNAGNDVIICAGASGQLSGSATAGTGGGTGSSGGTIVVTISGTGWQDMVSWTLTNASGTSIGSGGPYAFGATTTVTIPTPGTGPYSFYLETLGTICDNTVNYNITCNGSSVSSGTVGPCNSTTVSVTNCGSSGGTSTLPITYSWSPATALSSTTILNPTASPTTTTTYTLTATQGTCSSQDQVTVYVNPLPTVNAGPDVTLCGGQTSTVLNGTASASGGFTGPITVNVFSGSNLDETTWTITNSLGAVIATGGPYATGSNNSFTIANPTNPPFTFAIETQGASNSNVAGYNILCGGTTGTSISGGIAILTGGQTASIPITGCAGTITPTVTWSPGATLSSTNTLSTTATPSATTTYTLTATANGCTNQDQVTVTIGTPPSVSVNSPSICAGQTATLTATPATAGGTYLWSPGGQTTSSISVSPTSTSTYSVVYTLNGCASVSTSGTVTVAPSPTVSIAPVTFCPGSAVTLTATANPTGGSYNWAPGGQTSNTITVSPSGTTNYTVNYSLSGCPTVTATGTATVANVVDWANIQWPGSSSICEGQTLTIYGQVYEAGLTNPVGQAAGITVSYAVSTTNTNPATWPASAWTSANYNPLSSINPNNDEYSGTLSGLTAGTYYYAFSYTYNGCTVYGGFNPNGGGFWDGTNNVNGVVTVSANTTPTFNPVAAICSGAVLNPLPTTSNNGIGGTWSPALDNTQTTSYTFTPSTGFCGTTTNLTITVNALPTAAITNNTNATELNCTTTSISLTGTGGGTYEWNDGTATIGTNAGLNITNPGVYELIVTNAAGCQEATSLQITQDTISPTVAISVGATELNCTTTSISLNANGATNYTWYNGTTTLATGATLIVNTPGTYTVVGAEPNGCTATASEIITQNIVAPTLAITNLSGTTTLNCTATTISLNASGGSSYSWSNGTSVVSTTAALGVTAPGTYTVSSTGANGCVGTASITIIQDISTPNIALSNTNGTLLNCSNTSTTLTASGANSYSWSNGTSIVGTTASINVTTPGTYTVTATGANGCTSTANQAITQDLSASTASISSSVANNTLTCTTTSIALTASGGGTYSWATGTTNLGTQAAITVNSIGTYTVTVTGANGCSATASTTVTQNISAPVAGILNNSNTTVLTCTQTSISVTANGGTTYSWSNGTSTIGATASLAITNPGTYTVTATAANGCIDSEVITITQNIVAPTASITNNSNTTVLTCSQTSISLTASGGVSYSWSNGTSTVGTAAGLSITSPGTYTVTTTAANGCTDTEVINITQDITTPTAAIANGGNTTILDCNTTSIVLTASGGVSYSWSNGSSVVGTTAQLQVTTAGTYTVTVTAANGCTDTELIVITYQANTNPTFTQIAPICAGGVINLPTTSNNAVNGSWSPATNVNATTMYTFTPNTGLCANTATMTIVVNPYPTITAQNDTICAGSNGTITTQINLIGGTYAWNNSTNTQANLSAAPNATSTYTVIYNLAGCTDTASAQIVVNPVPVVQVQNATICAGQTGALIATANLANGAYLWANGSTNDTLLWSPNATSSQNVTYTLNGCTSAPVTATLTVNPVPTITMNNQTICAGDPVTMQANANPAGTYYWVPNGVQGIASNTFTPTQDSTIEVYNILNGCSSDTIQATITVLPLPISSFSANVLQGCVPLSVGFSADVLNNTTYAWQTSNQLSASGPQATLDFQVNGSFSVTLTATLNGCSSSTTVANMIEVDNYPIAAFEPSSQVFTEPNQALSFWNSSVGASTYQWNFGDGGSSSEEAPTHIFDIENEGTTVLLYAYSNLGCPDTASYYIGFDPGLVYYIPNSFTPDGDQFNQTFLPIFTSGIDPYNYQLLIYNRWGEVIFESLNPGIGWDGTFGQQGNPCPVGTYTYMITVKLPSVDKRQAIKGHVNLIR